jgi:hypothetical protein
VNALLAFVATLVSLRLTAELVRRHRARRTPGLAAWTASLAAFSVASGALSWGAAAGWSEPAFRLYYLCGALLTAALLGAGSLLRIGLRWPAPAILVYSGLAIGVAVAAPLVAPVTGTEIPAAQDLFELWPARLLAIVGNSLGTIAAVGVAVWTIRSRPLGNALLLAGIAVAAVGSAVVGLGVAGSALFSTAAALLLYGGFVSRR